MKPAILAALILYSSFLTVAAPDSAQAQSSTELQSEHFEVARQTQAMLTEFFKTLDTDRGSESRFNSQMSLLRFWHVDLSSPETLIHRTMPLTSASFLTDGDRARYTALLAEVFRRRIFTTFEDLRSKEKDILKMALDYHDVPAWIASRAILASISDDELKKQVDARLASYGVTPEIARDLLSRELSFEITSVDTLIDTRGNKGFKVTVLLAPEITKGLIAKRTILPELGVQSVNDYYVTFILLPRADSSGRIRYLLWDHVMAGIYMERVIRDELKSIDRMRDPFRSLARAISRWNLSSDSPSLLGLFESFPVTRPIEKIQVGSDLPLDPAERPRTSSK